MPGSRPLYLPILLLLPLFAAASPRAGGEKVEFNRDIRPILSDNCFTCHGPDEAQRMSPLRLDTAEGAFADLGGRFAIVPGNPERSVLIQRITHENESLRMPPRYSGKTLAEEEIALLRRWIEQGAEWETHWAYRAPMRPPLPEVKQSAWPRNEIDSFILERLEQEGLSPSPEADPARLLRRVTLDLTGLPPALDELDAFLANPSPDNYERAVDRLLASPRCGERMAIRWLDAARYADTNGYQTDAERYMWRWRDWVIEAFNSNKPFDEFTLEQIAGDMLPNPTLDQLIATGFNRNHRGNGEGGIIAAEYAVEYVVDRVETTSTVWLGSTMGCARCHDHKYDPFSQRDFYRMFAYFNNVPERGKAFKFGNSPPMIPAPTREQRAELARLDETIDEARQKFKSIEEKVERAQRKWEKTLALSAPQDWVYPERLQVRLALEPGGTGLTPKEGELRFGVAPPGSAVVLDGKTYVEAGDYGDFDFYNRFSASFWVYPESAGGPLVTRTDFDADSEGRGYDGWGVYLKDGKIQVNFINRWLDDCLRVETAEPIAQGEWRHIVMSYDGSRLADGIKVYVNGEPRAMKTIVDEMNQFIKVKDPLRIGAGGGVDNRFQGRIADVRIFNDQLTPAEAALLAVPQTLNEIAAIPAAERTKAQADKLRLAFLNDFAPNPIRKAWRQLRELYRQREDFVDSFPTVMVMQERETPRQTHILERGAYDAPGEAVEPGIPAVLPPLPPGAPDNRLGFAKWLVHPSNPLTARVTVNRFWQMFFGRGIVRTVEDFGSQGEPPTHPELLDWLAVEFVESGWDVKALLKKIVTSAAYQQRSAAPPELVERDPENRLLARGPRFRLAPEMVRDQALAISGLLVEKFGGPSVKPYQPAGLWSDLGGGKGYQQGHGEDLYRRSLYTFWKRSVAPPRMILFDSAGREACEVRETRTNTPLQALNLMNDVTYVEASRVLAERMIREGGDTPEERIGFAFRLATARFPDGEETRVLADSFRFHLGRFQSDTAAALDLLSQGEHPRDESLDPTETAAYAMVASLILNLDETLTKE